MTLLLASTSPTRKLLLSQAGLLFETVRPEVDEESLRAANPQWVASEVAPALAQAKAVTLSARHGAALVLGADQTLILGDKVFAKPVDEVDARRQLLELRGRSHRLHSALCCARHGKPVWTYDATAELVMREWTPAFIDDYVKRVGCALLSTVGGYKIEGLGLQLFSRVSGDYSVILGLPLLPLLAFLRDQGEIAS